MDGVVRTGALAQTALDALLLVNNRTLLVERDGLLAADLAARMRKAALARIGHFVHVVLACVARELDDVDQRRIIVRVGDGGIREALAHANRTVNALLVQAHRKTNSLLDDRALEEDALAVGRNLTRHDLVRQLLEMGVEVGVGPAGIIRRLVYDLGDLGKDATTNVCQIGVDTAHGIGHVHPSSW